jgi:hypothetical protein
VDPDGLAQRGHHIVPEALWLLFGFDLTVAREVFDADNAKIRTKSMMRAANTHNNTAHGKTGYSGYVAAEMDAELCKFMTDREKKVGMSKTRQKAFATKFLDHIQNQPLGTYIGDFNDEVSRNGRVGQNTMKKTKGTYTKHSFKSPSINASSGEIRWLMKSKMIVSSKPSWFYFGRKTTKFLVPPGVGFIFMFNELRANGAGVAEATLRAAGDEFFCTEYAVDAANFLGDQYANSVDWGMNNNRLGPRNFDAFLEDLRR